MSEVARPEANFEDAHIGTDPTEGVDDVPRPVVALAWSAPKKWHQALHSHRRGHLIYAKRGVIHCEIQNGVWIVPPQCAIWIPGDVPYSASSSGATETSCLYVDQDFARDLPEECCTVALSPLIASMLEKVVSFPREYPLGGREERLVAVLLDELATAPHEGFYVPMPNDDRLRKLAQMVMEHPADSSDLRAWKSVV